MVVIGGRNPCVGVRESMNWKVTGPQASPIFWEQCLCEPGPSLGQDLLRRLAGFIQWWRGVCGMRMSNNHREKRNKGEISVWVPAEPSRATAAIFKLNMCGAACPQHSSPTFNEGQKWKPRKKTNPQYGKEKEAQLITQSSQGAARDRKKGQAPRVPS